MSYTKVVWKDYPSTATPINAANLGIMDQGIADAHSLLATAQADLDVAEANIISLGTQVAAKIPTANIMQSLDDMEALSTAGVYVADAKAVGAISTNLNGVTANLYELDFADKIDLKTALDAVGKTYTFQTNGVLCYKFTSAAAANAYRLNSSTGVPILFAQAGGASYELAGRVHVSKGEIGTVAYFGITINSLYFVPFK